MNFFDSLEPQEITHNIREIIHCPFCGSDYQKKHIKILAKLEGNYILHLSCDNCSNSIMANLSYKQRKTTSTQKNKMDVKLDEMVQFAKEGSVSDDNVMDFYKAMGNFDGDFTKLFFGNKKINDKIKWKKKNTN